MDTEQLEKYLESNIVPLYLDARDSPGLRVLLLVDSGPGRGSEKMLAQMKLRGFYLVAGVPNTTHVTQPTNQNYGMFKNVYQMNLDKLTEITKVCPNDIPLLIFGGRRTNERTKKPVNFESAFELAFGVDKNRDVWSTLGFYPFTRKCLLDTKVKH